MLRGFWQRSRSLAGTLVDIFSRRTVFITPNGCLKLNTQLVPSMQVREDATNIIYLQQRYSGKISRYLLADFHLTLFQQAHLLGWYCIVQLFSHFSFKRIERETRACRYLFRQSILELFQPFWRQDRIAILGLFVSLSNSASNGAQPFDSKGLYELIRFLGIQCFDLQYIPS